MSEPPDTRTGHQYLAITVDGEGVEKLENESGGHRIQRIPKSERNGRVHSSTVTVAVMDGGAAGKTVYDQRAESAFEIQWYNGTIGAGGQNHAKTAACARVKHIPSGVVRTAQTRSRKNSLANAMQAINAELDRLSSNAVGTAVNGVRRQQVGSGMRSDKRRTYRFQDGKVHDHGTGKSASVDHIMKGEFRLIW